MLQGILSQIESWAKENKILEDTDLNNLLKQLRLYKQGEWIYPGVLVRQIGMSVDKVYLILEHLKKLGILEVNYEIYCHSCHQFEGSIYSTISKVPNNIECENCAGLLNKLDNTIVIYRVINDGDC